ncbi:extracellular solute-binding protein [Paenibacillus nanensis]|uniref:Extracellular solute-binding protein n=1 Tax=Paenibacillus nanensis TaxID=393251 RepID=A0A3A1VS71_9BACL|nr:extracellular solute-binding protein [Paenibacillus nanensis]RIX60350.1 extracellular solute-binding protein [Paenibacillus nanensis]
MISQRDHVSHPKFRYVSIIWVLLLAVLLTACSKGPGTPAASAEARKPVVSIMAPLHFPHPPHEDVVQEIERRTGVELEIVWVPNEIYTDKMNTSLTTNSMKKVTFVKNTDYVFLKTSIRSGAFWEIGPYLKDYPNLKHLNTDILQQAAVEGKIYGLYTERPSSRQGVILRKDWLDALQMKEPGTIEELYEVIRRFTQDDPDRNGQHDTIGLTDRNDLIYGAFKTLSSYFGAPNNWGVEGERLIPEFETQPYFDTMDFMKRLYAEGLMNQDFAVTSKQMQRDLLIRGKAGVYIGSMTDVQRLADEAQKINPEAEFTVVNRIKGPTGYHVWSIPNYNGLYLFSKKAIPTEEELRRILQFFDSTMEKDVANMLRYGFEGRHYLVKDGKVVLPEESSQKRVTEVNALHALMIADLSNPNLMRVSEGEPLMEFAEQLSQDNEKFIVKDPVAHLESATYDERGAALYKIVSDATYNYMLGHIGKEQFREEIRRWREEGGDAMIQEYTKAYFGE